METKGVTCKIPLDLHNRISEEIRETESTMSKISSKWLSGNIMRKGLTRLWKKEGH